LHEARVVDRLHRGHRINRSNLCPIIANEARDVLSVLQNEAAAPADLRQRALQLAGVLLELGGAARPGDGEASAASTLDSGRAWAKFQGICEAQGGMRDPPLSSHRHPICAERAGRIERVDNRKLARVAKLAGAPDAKAAGVEVHVHLNDVIETGQPLYTVHAEAPGELAYALEYAATNTNIYEVIEP
jgi:thymidine phosphorylase